MILFCRNVYGLENKTVLAVDTLPSIETRLMPFWAITNLENNFIKRSYDDRNKLRRLDIDIYIGSLLFYNTDSVMRLANNVHAFICNYLSDSLKGFGGISYSFNNLKDTSQSHTFYFKVKRTKRKSMMERANLLIASTMFLYKITDYSGILQFASGVPDAWFEHIDELQRCTKLFKMLVQSYVLDSLNTFSNLRVIYGNDRETVIFEFPLK